ncbi:MAG: tRNA dihydrouridine synthase DusB [Myxococcales bacterium]|nr:tRNA dihydrouridine synthase DusB [Myxococcales bacterium]
MAGVSQMPFRVLAFRMGAGLCPTELISAQGLMRSSPRTLRYLRYDPEVERPYSLQLFGGEPEAMARAAAVAKQHGAQVIDINMGCPVRKVTKSGAGSALLCDPLRAARIVTEVRSATGLPVTAKIRSGWDSAQKSYLEVALALEEAGLAALAVHPRTRAQGYSGSADWSVITELKRRLRMPVIGNGDVRSPLDARRMLEATGCDAVMIGRAALGNPWIFRELLGGAPPTPKERCELVLEHFRRHLEHGAVERLAVRSFRKHLGWYSHGLRGAASFRSEANRLERAAEVEAAARRFFAQAAGEPSPDAEREVDYRAAFG